MGMAILPPCAGIFRTACIVRSWQILLQKSAMTRALRLARIS
jgi:hypothetical protein